MTRGARLALVLAAAGLLCTLGLCGAGAVLGPQLAEVAGCRDTGGPAVSSVRDDPGRVREILPPLGDPVAAHWRWRETRPRTCPDLGPMDYIYEGFATLPRERVGALRSAYDWIPTTAPDVPADLAPHAPAAPDWLSSPAFDAATHAHVWLDAGSGTVYFTYLRG